MASALCGVRVHVCVWVRERERERKGEYVCVWNGLREGVCVWRGRGGGSGKRERGCMCVRDD